MLDILSQSNQASPTADLDFDLPCVIGNLDSLPMNIFIDNTPYAPCAYLVAQDINPSTGVWASRHNVSKTMSVAGAGTAPTYGNYSAIENTAARYAIAKYHAAADTTWGQLTDKDYALEFVYTLVSDGSLALASTSAVGANSNGFLCYASSNRLIFRHGAAAGDIDTNSAFVVANNSIAHAMVFGDRSEKCYIYINGIYCASTDISARTNNLTQNSLQIGAWGGAIQHGGDLLLAAIWDLPSNPFPGVLKNRTYFDRIARERFEIISGCQDQRGGSMSFTRATSAYLDKYISTTERRLFNVSAGWPRVCERKDANSLYVKGFLSEPANQNKCVQSEDLATTWTATNITSVSANAIAAPTGNLTADGLVGDADNDVHDVYQAITCAASAHCFSVFAKKGNKDWIELYSNTTNVTCYFDLANGVVGTAGAGITASGIEAFGNDWYRSYVIFTGSASAQNFHLRSAHADTDNTFAGDATTVNTYFWGAQVEAVTEYFPSSYIPTVAAAVTRNKDELSYNIKLPIVGNINDLSQSLNIGGTDYAPCAYLVADDCQADGTWTSRHGAKSLAFAGAGTNPTPNWSAVSRANRSVKYWASNYHQAADTTWGTFAANDGAIEIILNHDATLGYVLTTNAASSGTEKGYTCYCNGGTFRCYLDNGAGTAVSVAGPASSGIVTHFMVCFDRSEKMYLFVNGVYYDSSDISSLTGDITESKLTIGASPVGGSLSTSLVSQAAVWDLGGAVWPGAATNQAVMGAIARARFNQLFRYESCRLDCDILHPNVNRQGISVPIFCGSSLNDYQYSAILGSDYVSSEAKANAATQWSSAGSTDVCNGVKNKISSYERSNSYVLKLNNVNQFTDASCDLPSNLSKMYIGSWNDGTLQPACIVSNVKLFRNDRR